MHLLNTLPQRLDPGATPTFAGLIAPSLTSPAATNLTLGTTDSGAAITVLSASNNVGIGTATPNKKLEVFKDVATNTLGSGEVLRILGDDGNTVGRVTELGFGVGPTGATFASALIGAVNISAAAFGTKDLYFATRSSTVDVAPTERMRIASTGDVSIASTTAASSGVGALVVQGGISAGNTGAASYFGGNTTVNGEFRASNIRLENGTFIAFGSANGEGMTGSQSTNSLTLRTNSTTALTINSAQAATFAGAVSVSGTAATWTSGTGSPESVKTAPVGSLYTRTDGGASTTLYVKESGAGNTGWIAK